jgi:hypothetical protein
MQIQLNAQSFPVHTPHIESIGLNRLKQPFITLNGGERYLIKVFDDNGQECKLQGLGKTDWEKLAACVDRMLTDSGILKAKKATTTKDLSGLRLSAEGIQWGKVHKEWMKLKGAKAQTARKAYDDLIGIVSPRLSPVSTQASSSTAGPKKTRPKTLSPGASSSKPTPSTSLVSGLPKDIHEAAVRNIREDLTTMLRNKQNIEGFCNSITDEAFLNERVDAYSAQLPCDDKGKLKKLLQLETERFAFECLKDLFSKHVLSVKEQLMFEHNTLPTADQIYNAITATSEANPYAWRLCLEGSLKENFKKEWLDKTGDVKAFIEQRLNADARPRAAKVNDCIVC